MRGMATEKGKTNAHDAIRRYEFYVHGGQVVRPPRPPFSGWLETISRVVLDKESGTIKIVPVSEEKE